MMKQLFSVTLTAKQVRMACEEFVKQRINPATEVATAVVDPAVSVTVNVHKRYLRKPKEAPDAFFGTAGKEPAHE
jgi:hypothetical protein